MVMSMMNAITVSVFTVIFIIAIFTALKEEEFAKAVAGAVVALCLFGLYFSQTPISLSVVM